MLSATQYNIFSMLGAITRRFSYSQHGQVSRRGMKALYSPYINGKYFIPESAQYFDVKNPANMDHCCKYAYERV